MIYNPAKIKKLHRSIEDHLTDEEKEIMKEILFNYNKLCIYVKNKKQDEDRRLETYVKESSQNNILIEENKELKKWNKIFKQENKELREYITKLQAELRRYKKIFE